MAALLKLRQAARLIGVSPGRLYRAIADGRLAAAPGGGPGKPTLISLEALQTFCQRESLRVPDEAEMVERAERLERSGRSERAERSMEAPQDLETLAGHSLARVMERQSTYFDLFLKEELTHLVERIIERVVDQVTERLAERLATEPLAPMERSERSGRTERSITAAPDPRTAVLTRLRLMRAEGLSLQAMANRFNQEGVPTLSGKGLWQKGTIGKLLAGEEE